MIKIPTHYEFELIIVPKPPPQGKLVVKLNNLLERLCEPLNDRYVKCIRIRDGITICGYVPGEWIVLH